MNRNITIISIIPATGWSALYASPGEAGKCNTWMKPLVCWALCQTGNEPQDRCVEGIDSDCSGTMVFCSEISNFVCYVKDGTPSEQIQQWAEDWVKTQGEQQSFFRERE